MGALLEALRDPASMTGQQWLLVGIMAFVVAGVLYFVYRLYRIIENERKSSYVPNIGRKRLREEARQQAEHGPEEADEGRGGGKRRE